MAFEGLTDKLNKAFKSLRSKGKLNENDVKSAMREVRLALLEADVNFKVAKDFINSVTEKCIGEKVMESLTPAQMVVKIVEEELAKLMGDSEVRINMASKGTTVIMMCGLQGSGKTTHAAKLAKLFRNEGKRPMICACDIYRPAAIEQLKIVGEKANAHVFEMGKENPVKIAKEGLKYAKDYGYDVMIIDTAGRLQIDEVLMQELKDIKEATNPHEILLTIDSMLGQDAVNVAKAFDEAVSIDGVVLTKLDGDSRGGAALSVRAVTGKPIKFVGMGEKIDDLEIFYPDRMASRILGMGDVLTLIEKAQKDFDEKETQKLAKKMSQNSFDMDDLLNQMRQIKKMGPLDQIMSMIPGLAGKIDDETAEAGNNQMKFIEAIISSMTLAERKNPEIINPSRKKRIAAGSGTQVSDVNRLLKQFKDMKKMMKQLGKLQNNKRFGGMMGSGMPPMM